MRLNFIYCLFGLFIISAVIRCDLGFPAFSKDLRVSGHTKFKKGALHKEGYEEPFGENGHEEEKGCSSDNCHQNDLKGGLTEITNLVAPSCYQCHGNKWEDHD